MEDDIFFRQDAGPPPKPGTLIIPLVVVKFETVINFLKSLWRKLP